MPQLVFLVFCLAALWANKLPLQSTGPQDSVFFSSHGAIVCHLFTLTTVLNSFLPSPIYLGQHFQLTNKTLSSSAGESLYSCWSPQRWYRSGGGHVMEALRCRFICSCAHLPFLGKGRWIEGGKSLQASGRQCCSQARWILHRRGGPRCLLFIDLIFLQQICIAELLVADRPKALRLLSQCRYQRVG